MLALARMASCLRVTGTPGEEATVDILVKNMKIDVVAAYKLVFWTLG